MTVVSKIPALLAAIFVGITPAYSAPLTEADLKNHVAALVENKTLQAVSLGVIQREGFVTAHAGVLSATRPVPPDDRTLYEIGSISKVFTALLLADAVVRGEVALDTPIARLLPADVELPDGAGDRITLLMLVTHTSGLPRIPAELSALNFTNPYAGYDDEDLWKTLRNVTLDFEPGTKAGYSNLAAGLLGTLLARNARTTYADLLATRVTQPLGMNDTVLTPDPAQRERFAPPFTAAGLPWSYWEFKALAGAGGIRSTTADMMRFATAVLRPADAPQPLQKSIELAWERQSLSASISPGGQALGWMLAGDGKTRWHNGMTGGFHAALFINREHGVASLLLSNRSTPVGTGLAESLFRRAAGMPEPVMPNRDRAEVALSEAQLDRCTGTFRLSPKFAMTFERRNLALYITPTGQVTERLYAASAGTFFSRRIEAEVVFELPADGGPATALTLKQNGRETRALRE
jgi:D-alanyl-D-alanine-carboxypeptidase/D-alanyl-D-alanine-endopeptidase